MWEGSLGPGLRVDAPGTGFPVPPSTGTTKGTICETGRRTSPNTNSKNSDLELLRPRTIRNNSYSFKAVQSRVSYYIQQSKWHTLTGAQIKNKTKTIELSSKKLSEELKFILPYILPKCHLLISFLKLSKKGNQEN